MTKAKAIRAARRLAATTGETAYVVRDTSCDADGYIATDDPGLDTDFWFIHDCDIVWCSDDEVTS